MLGVDPLNSRTRTSRFQVEKYFYTSRCGPTPAKRPYGCPFHILLFLIGTNKLVVLLLVVVVVVVVVVAVMSACRMRAAVQEI